MKLIVINGPCGVGKSTVALRLHNKIPLAFLLDVDAQTRFISHYKEYGEERRELMKAISMGIIDSCLSVGCTVIVDKMTFDPQILDAYHALGEKHHAETYEIILWAPKNVVMSRANARGWVEGGMLTPEKCERFWNEIDALRRQRALAKVIDTNDLNEEGLLQELERVTNLG